MTTREVKVSPSEIESTQSVPKFCFHKGAGVHLFEFKSRGVTVATRWTQHRHTHFFKLDRWTQTLVCLSNMCPPTKKQVAFQREAPTPDENVTSPPHSQRHETFKRQHSCHRLDNVNISGKKEKKRAHNNVTPCYILLVGIKSSYLSENEQQTFASPLTSSLLSLGFNQVVRGTTVKG